MSLSRADTVTFVCAGASCSKSQKIELKLRGWRGSVPVNLSSGADVRAGALVAFRQRWMRQMAGVTFVFITRLHRWVANRRKSTDL